MIHYASDDFRLIDNAVLYRGDCLDIMPTLPPGSVDLILTDLPYGTVKNIAAAEGIDHGMKGRTEWDNCLDTSKIYEIVNSVVRKNGKMILFAQQPFTTELISKAHPNIPFNYNMIWKKDHFANALFAKKAPLNYYEDILVFSKLYNVHSVEFIHPLRPYFKEIFEYIGHTKSTIIKAVGQRADHSFRFNSSQFSLCTEKTYNELISNFCIDKMQGFKNFGELLRIDVNINPSVFNLWEGGKYKSNIMEYKKDYTGHHPTQKPVLLLEDLIKTYTNEGDTVLDFTMGSGSTGVACKNTNRKFIGIEMDKKYFEIASTRIDTEGTK